MAPNNSGDPLVVWTVARRPGEVTADATQSRGPAGGVEAHAMKDVTDMREAKAATSRRPTRSGWAVALALAAVASLTGAEAFGGPFLDDQRRHPRVEAAYEAHRGDVEARFRAAKAAWPPQGLFLRAFKADDVVELWAAPAEGDRLVLVRAFPVCARSGALGPKAVSGDLQVPEGFYRVDRFNPRSRYHLSLGLDYPNAVDRARAGERPPGGDIFIHGACVTIGCLPLEDEPMAWLYLAAVLARDAGQAALPVHIFPCRLGDPRCAARLAEASAGRPDLADFWDSLRPGYEAFVETGRPPHVVARRTGYRVTRAE